jgi:hypothetical protein
MGDDERLYAQEVLGAVYSNGSSVFQSRWIEELKNRPVRPVPGPAGRICLTMIDPGGSGDSRSAIISIVREATGHIIIVGMAEGDLTAPADLPKFVQGYFKQFSDDLALASMPGFICVERNYGNF